MQESKAAVRSTKACEACRQRKVKCSGGDRCSQCTHSGLTCRYQPDVPGSRSRRMVSRGHVIEACKGSEVTDRGRRLTTPSESIESTASAASIPLLLDTTPELITFVDSLFDDYNSYVLPIIPIIDEWNFRSAVRNTEVSRESKALVHSLAAVTLHKTPLMPEVSQQRQQHVVSLLTTALRVRGPLLPDQVISIPDIMVSLLSSVCFSASDRWMDTAFHYLRDAITKLQILRVGRPETTFSRPAGEQAQLERLYWLVFVHERFFSISQRRLAVLSVIPTLPTTDPCWSAGIQDGFSHVVLLFRAVDSEFIEHWVDRSKRSMTFQWIQSKQAELGHGIDVWEYEIGFLSEMQQIDLIVTRYWLRTLVWQMALSKLSLSSKSTFEQDLGSIIFPARLSSRLQSLLTATPRQAVEVHGTGILKKIFDITITLADVLEYVVGMVDHYEDESHNLSHFLFFYDFLVSMSTFYHVERTALENKLHVISVLFSPAQMSPRTSAWETSDGIFATV